MLKHYTIKYIIDSILYNSYVLYLNFNSIKFVDGGTIDRSICTYTSINFIIKLYLIKNLLTNSYYINLINIKCINSNKTFNIFSHECDRINLIIDNNMKTDV